MLRLAFVALRHDAVDVADGGSAMLLHEQRPVDLVLLDQKGLEAVEQLRRRNPDVKIIAMSGGGRIAPRDFQALAKRKGADLTLMKPFSLQELAAAVDAILTPRAHRDAAGPDEAGPQ